jgi:hypothetical protein
MLSFLVNMLVQDTVRMRTAQRFVNGNSRDRLLIA